MNAPNAPPLHDIITRYVLALSSIDDETGEVPESISAMLDELAPELEHKVEALAAVRAQAKAEADACKRLAEAYTEKAASRIAHAERIERYTDACLQRAGLDRVKAPTAHVYYQANESVEVDDVDALPEQYRVTKTTTAADKTAIKAAIKAGEHIEHARIVVKHGLRWK